MPDTIKAVVPCPQCDFASLHSSECGRTMECNKRQSQHPSHAGATVIELTEETNTYCDPKTGADTDEVAARRWVSEWEDTDG